METIKLLCVVGPTASGKTALAVALARLHGAEIVSADSMQVYRRMDIGTAKPDAAERGGVPHHMLDILEPWENYSAAQYAAQARACVEDIAARGRLPIVAGGTGLYLDALLGRLRFPPEEADPELRERLAQEARREGPAFMHAKLAALDPEAAAKIHPNNQKRTLRALEIFIAAGRRPSQPPPPPRDEAPPYEPCILGLCPEDRGVLYGRIDRRVDEMMARGLPAEARALWEEGNLSQTAAQAIGYKELFAYFEGRCGLAEATEAIRQGSRRYAKRQLTWFRADPAVHWILYPANVNFNLILQNSQETMRSCAIL